MTTDQLYMHRCLQLALNGKGYTSPNPMVGAVVVHNGLIIGEGYHRRCGEAHAEVNAINSVADKALLSQSTIYVSLEPCSHYGKTPPCSQLIIDHRIPRVVIACPDPFAAVSGRGIAMLQDAGIQVQVGVLRQQAEHLNREFITAQTLRRPYIYLKWAQSADGYIDHNGKPVTISNSFTRMLVHKLRAEVDAIMVGTNTAVNDNPSLSTRLWHGNNPVRVTIDRHNRIPADACLFDNAAPTIVFGHDMSLPDMLHHLQEQGINSLLVEGGRQLLQSFIDSRLWDEAFVEIAQKDLTDGTPAPQLTGKVIAENHWGNSRQVHLMRQ